jgi:DNA-directed RNA polymerase subunit RPC12/RpoP
MGCICGKTLYFCLEISQMPEFEGVLSLILFRCPCGAEYRVEDHYAGGAAECEECGSRVSIPRQSDPEVLLIFKAGDEKDGSPISREHVNEQLASGVLQPTDLYWTEEGWRPLDPRILHPEQDTSEKEVGEVTGKLLIAPDSAPMTEETLIAVDLPLLEVAPDRVSSSCSPVVSKKPAAKLLTVPWLRSTAVAAVLMVGAFLGYRDFLGPLVFRLLNCPATVEMHNGGKTACTITIQEKPLRLDMKAQESASLRAFIGWPKRVRLTVGGATGEDGLERSVMLWPAKKTVLEVAPD